jgi:hypothetical protein
MPGETSTPGGRGRRLLWFLGLWVAGVVVMALVTWTLRALIVTS